MFIRGDDDSDSLTRHGRAAARPLTPHVSQVVRILPDNTGTDELGNQQVRACVRGRSIRQRIYNPDRLKRPMKRKEGTKRGEEQWEEISWDQALTEIAEKMKDIKARYGNEAFYIHRDHAGLPVFLRHAGRLQFLRRRRQLQAAGHVRQQPDRDPHVGRRAHVRHPKHQA